MLYHRTFADYKEYVFDQGRKVRTRPEQYDVSNPRPVAAFTAMFENVKSYLKPGSILCLGARAGWEIVGASNAGFTECAGIDLHPASPIVRKADWHNMPFADSRFDTIFTNSIDHCLDLPKLVAEIKRVLVPGGVFFLLASYREVWKKRSIEERMQHGVEALFWDHPNDLLPEFQNAGFVVFKAWMEDSHGYYFMRKRDGN